MDFSKIKKQKSLLFRFFKYPNIMRSTRYFTTQDRRCGFGCSKTDRSGFNLRIPSVSFSYPVECTVQACEQEGRLFICVTRKTDRRAFWFWLLLPLLIVRTSKYYAYKRAPPGTVYAYQ